MKPKVFLQLVELPTKAASMIPFCLGTVYALFRFDRLDGLNLLLMAVSLLSFDMATTAINNYFDFKKAIKTSGYGYESHNAITRYKLSERSVLTVIFTLLILASLAGLLLVWNSHLLVLALGGLSFAVGILYTFGPVPISRMPLGEIISGLFMGFVIIFISAFIHTDPDQLVRLTLGTWADGTLMLQIKWLEVIDMLVISLPAVTGIANIMLANNICDMEDDLVNKRYTLPLYIGRKNALRLFRGLYYVGYLDLPALFLLGVHPLLLALILLTLLPLNKNIRRFESKQVKAETFDLAVRNFALTVSARIVILALAVALNRLL